MLEEQGRFRFIDQDDFALRSLHKRGKSIEVGGLPFDLHQASPSCDSIAAVAYNPKLNADGVAVLPADWDDDNGD